MKAYTVHYTTKAKGIILVRGSIQVKAESKEDAAARAMVILMRNHWGLNGRMPRIR
jgi:hypothetical protein